MFFSPFSFAIISLGDERAGLCAFHTFVCFALVGLNLFSLPLGVRDLPRLVIAALPGLFFLPLFLVVAEGRREYEVRNRK